MSVNRIKRKKQKSLLNLIIVLVLILCSAAGGFFIGHQTKNNSDITPTSLFSFRDLPKEFNYSLMKEVWKIVQRDYVDKDNIDNQSVFYTMMKGLAAGVDDPYTVFLTPEETDEFNEDIDGKFQGIGAEITEKEGKILIVAPLPESPALKAGIQAGDQIIAIDDADTTGMTLAKAVNTIRGEKGTIVKLTVLRNGGEVLDIEITRDVIYVKSVNSEILENNIGYIEIGSFNTDTNSLFDEAAADLKEKKVSAIILDMRNNPGGLLDSAIHVASAWVENSNVVVVEQFGDGREVNYNAKNNPILKDIPTVVLINGGSASGSEIVAGALKDYEQATLVGMQTFGKGSVQNLQTLSDGSSIKITIAKWLTPNGSSINDEGIFPDVEIDMTREDYENEADPQLDEAIKILLEK